MVDLAPTPNPSAISQATPMLLSFCVSFCTRPTAFSDLTCHPYVFLLLVSHSLNFDIPHHLLHFINVHIVEVSAEWKFSLIGYIRDLQQFCKLHTVAPLQPRGS